MSGYYLGLDIGGTKCAVILGEAKPEGGVRILERTALLTSSLKKWEDVLKALCVRGGTMLENLEDGRSRLQAVGISCGGPLDSRRGVILSPPNLPGWDQVPAVSFIRERMDRPVFLQNDANACALAEWKYGAGRGCRNMIFLTFGTGLGAGLILNGKLYTGTNDMAGEAGHVRLSPHGPVGYGKEGSFEGFCSGGGIARIAATKVLERLQRGEHPSFCPDYLSIGSLTAKDVSEAAGRGDPIALEVFEQSASYLGYGLSILVDLLNPERIVIGSVYARSEKLFRETMQKIMKQECLPDSLGVCEVKAAQLGDQIGDYAALSVAIDGVTGVQ